MKKLIAGFALLACGAAWASGPFDGVYQSDTNPEQFYTLHQNGDQLLLGGFGTLPTDGNIYLRYGADQFRPPKIYLWDVQNGALDGSSAIMTGGVLQNACTITYRLDLSPGRMVATLLRTEQRIGGVNCAALLPVGSISGAHKIF